MSTTISITELRKMPFSELQKELKEAKNEAARMRLNIEVQKEKNHAQFKHLKKQIARMTMVLAELSKKGLKETSPKASLSGASSATNKPKKPTQSKKPTKKKKSSVPSISSDSSIISSSNAN